jgi:hypothetical protein
MAFASHSQSRHGPGPRLRKTGPRAARLVRGAPSRRLRPRESWAGVRVLVRQLPDPLGVVSSCAGEVKPGGVCVERERPCTAGGGGVLPENVNDVGLVVQRPGFAWGNAERPSPPAAPVRRSATATRLPGDDSRRRTMPGQDPPDADAEGLRDFTGQHRNPSASAHSDGCWRVPTSVRGRSDPAPAVKHGRINMAAIKINAV